MSLALGLFLGISLVEAALVAWGYLAALVPGDTFVDWAEFCDEGCDIKRDFLG